MHDGKHDTSIDDDCMDKLLWGSINRPDHYNTTGIETIEVIKNSMNAVEFQGYLKGNILKYVARHMHKGMPLKDILKAQWYMGCLVEELREKEQT
jgi:hypothetical protein